MVKKYILSKIILLLIAVNVYSQNTEIKYVKEVYYKDTLYRQKANFRQRMPKKIIEQSNKVLKKYYYTLNFNDTLGEFKINQTPSSNIDIIATKIKGQGVYFKDLKNKEELNGLVFKNKKYIINEPFYDLDWQIIKSQTKKILNFKCFKAVSFRELKNGKKEKIIAWYSEEIPKPFGPNAYCNLPGVILLIEVNSFFLKHKYKCVFKAISIEKNKNKIIKPLGKLITNEDFKNISKN